MGGQFLSYRDFLHSNCLGSILQFLDPKDIPIISKAWRISWKKCEPYYIVTIARKIDWWFREYFGGRYEEFRICMIQDRAVVSGSFLLQLILGKTWKDSDIDIFMTKTGRGIVLSAEKWFRGIETFLYNIKGMVDSGSYVCSRYNREFGSKNLFEIRDYIIDKNFARYKGAGDEPGVDYDTPFGKNVYNFRSFLLGHEAEYNGPDIFNKFQIIELRVPDSMKDVIDFINKSFDFDICKNCFFYDQNGPRIILGNVEDVIRQKTEFKVANNIHSSLSRYQKYKNRGITFTKEERVEVIEKHLEVVDSCKKIVEVACQDLYQYLIDRMYEKHWIQLGAK